MFFLQQWRVRNYNESFPLFVEKEISFVAIWKWELDISLKFASCYEIATAEAIKKWNLFILKKPLRGKFYCYSWKILHFPFSHAVEKCWSASMAPFSSPLCLPPSFYWLKRILSWACSWTCKKRFSFYFQDIDFSIIASRRD